MWRRLDRRSSTSDADGAHELVGRHEQHHSVDAQSTGHAAADATDDGLMGH